MTKREVVLSKSDAKFFLGLLDQFESRMEGWKDNASIDKKNIQTINIEQVSWIGYYDELKVELKQHLDDLEHRLKRQKAINIKIIYNTAQKSITDRMVDKLSEENPEYEDIHTLYLEFKHLYDKADMIVRVFQQRAYAINNIVKIREKELEGITLHT